MAKQHDKQFKLDAVRYYEDHKNLGVHGCAKNLGIGYSTLTKWLNRFKIRDYKQAYRLIFEYLEAFYNTKRIHSHCDYISPDEFERVYERTHMKVELLAS